MVVFMSMQSVLLFWLKLCLGLCLYVVIVFSLFCIFIVFVLVASVVCKHINIERLFASVMVIFWGGVCHVYMLGTKN